MDRRPLELLLVINHLYPSGGAEIQLAHLARELAGMGHRVTICCVDDWSLDPAQLEAAGVRLVALRATTRLARLAAIPRLARLARRADVVQCTMWDASLWGRIAAIVARRPVVVADHATDRSIQVAGGGAPRGSWIARHNRLLDRFTFATVACASSQRPVLTREGVAPEKIVHIPNGIPLERLRQAAAAGLDRAAFGLRDDAFVAMQVAVFREEKNQLGALEAVAVARERIPALQLVFVGDGFTRPGVEARAAELGGGEWVRFVGERDDVPALLGLADAMLLPSLADAMPMTVLEAMAIGVPVVASDVGDVAETLGDAGVCVPPGDPGAIADALVRLHADPPLRAAMAEAGRARARAFDSTEMTRRYAALFEAASRPHGSR
ncbi:MAG TPA: glycosyltransferase [Solirubrobacterales bacterium]|nr:glycosyltransferase [Solirubrobacterales bacterium]